MTAEVTVEATIRDAIVRGFSGSLRSSVTLDRFMTDVETRDTSYLSALRIAAEDPKKKTNAARLISLYIVGFVPSEAVIAKIVEFCASHVENDPAAFEELHTIAVALHRRAQQTRFLDTPFVTSAASRAAPAHGDAACPPPHFTALPLFRCPHGDPYAGRTVMGIAPQKECALVAAEKNRKVKEHKGTAKYIFPVLTTKDYVDQTPLELSEEQLGRHMAVLTSYCEHYPHHPDVQLATSVFIKILLDAWVSKLAFGCDWAFLRQPTCAFLTPLLKMVGSDFLCVKKHAFDLLFNIAAHAQMFDTRDSFEHSTMTLEKEICWMIQQLIWRLVLQNEQQNEKIWQTVLKCCLVVVPQQSLHEVVDPRALALFLDLPCVAPCSPVVCSRIAAALAASLLKDGSDADSLPTLNAAQYSTLGGDECILRLYGGGAAPTLLARDAFFSVLFVSAVEGIHRRGGHAGQQSSPLCNPSRPGSLMASRGGHALSPRVDRSLAAKALRSLCALKFPWYFWSLIQFHNRDVLNDLKFDEIERDVKPTAFAVLGEMVQIVEINQKLPDSLNSPPIFHRSAEVVSSMIRDEDVLVRKTAVNFAFETLRSGTAASLHGGQLDEFLRVLSALPEAKSRRAAITVLSRVAILAKAYPSFLGVFAALLRILLAKETFIPNLLSIFHIILHFVTTPHTMALGEGDIVSHSLNGTMHIIQYVGEFVGYAQLWSLYWGLRADSPFQGEAVFRARQVLVSILAPMDVPESPSAMMTLWSRVMGDPFAPVAIIGARQVIRCSGLAHYDKYEAAINDAQRAEKSDLLKSNYMMASNILERVDAESQRFGAAASGAPGSRLHS